MSIRPVKRLIKAKPTDGGRGSALAPCVWIWEYHGSLIRFCCWTIYRNDVPEDYLAGLSLASATVESRRLLMCWRERWITPTASGTRVRFAGRDVQWMTAGSGIIHQEMPKGDAAGRMHGFQLWANLRLR